MQGGSGFDDEIVHGIHLDGHAHFSSIRMDTEWDLDQVRALHRHVHIEPRKRPSHKQRIDRMRDVQLRRCGLNVLPQRMDVSLQHAILDDSLFERLVGNKFKEGVEDQLLWPTCQLNSEILQECLQATCQAASTRKNKYTITL